MVRFAAMLLGASLALTAHPALASDESPFEVLTQDTSAVEGYRTEGDNVWIKLTSAHVSDTVTVRISDRNRDFYRPWFNGSTDLVSTGYRGNDVWSDRVQTKAKYIEYWVDDQLVLHLQRR